MNELYAYDFTLPDILIAQSPLPDRSQARLLVVDRKSGTIRHSNVREIPSLLQENDSLVVNNTKVVPARLIGNRTKSGGNWEGLFLGFTPDGFWKIMSKTRGKITAGETVSLHSPNGTICFALEMQTKLDDGTWIVRPRTDEEAFTALDRVGWVPIPPYIRGGKMVDSDKTDYQTIFASEPGAVAAPTAGLHFTDSLLNEIRNKHISIFPITLHVGAGTFRPITTERLDEHPMHSEWGNLSENIAEQINLRRKEGGKTVAIGTTSVRVLETAASEEGNLHPFCGETNLFIRPPYKFKAVDALITNFHFPKSTLYILVRTFGGDELIKEAYEKAIENEYRFFSYGDAMIVL